MPTLNHPPQELEPVDPLRPDGGTKEEEEQDQGEATSETSTPVARRTRVTRQPAPAAAVTPAAVEAAMAILRQAGMDVKIAEAPLGECPPDPITGRQGYFQSSRSQSGHRTVLRVYSGFDKDAKGQRPESPAVPTVRARGGNR
jgi:hypothetical protein